MRTRLWPFEHDKPVGRLACVTIGAALLFGLGACSFDKSRLDELRADNGIVDLDVPDAEGDGSPDADLDVGPGDLSDGGDDADVPVDVPVDMPADVPADVADQGDGVDQAGDPVDDQGGDAVDQGDDAMDAPAELPNQPPVLTLPGAQEIEGFLSLTIPGISLADPDAGGQDLELLVTASEGLVTMNVEAAGLELLTGDGDRDSIVELRGTLVELNTALDGLIFHTVGDGPVTGSLRFDVDDLGHSGTGGAQQITEFLQIDVLVREFDFRVQRGTGVMTSSDETLTLTAGVDYVAPTGPAFVRLTNTRLTGMGRITSGNTRDPEEWMAVIDDATNMGTSIVIRRAVHDQTCRVTWELVEYTGDPDGPNAFVVRDQRTFEYASTADLVGTSPAVAGVQDDADVVVFVTGQFVESNMTGDMNLALTTSEWDKDADTAVFRRGEGGDDVTLSYAVVEFTGTNWRVQRYTHTYGSSASSEPVVVDPVIDPARTFLHVQHRTATSLDRDTGALAWPAAVNALRFELQPQVVVAETMVTVAWLIANSATGQGAMQVAHIMGTRGNGGSAEEDIWTHTLATPVVNLAWSSIMGECAYVQGGTTNPPRGSIDVRLTALDTVELRQSERDGNKTYRFSVVQWPDD